MDWDAIVFPVTAICAVAGAAAVFLWARSGASARPSKRRPSGPVQEIECSECHRILVFNPLQLQPLIPVEKGLAVRSRPKLVGLPLAEYVCPFCAAAHCFSLEKKKPVWVGVNLYEAQEKSANCFECRVTLRRPAWPRGAYDGRVNEAPAVFPDHGMVCGRCNAVCCHGCCEETAHRRGEDSSLYCPRCMRKGITAFFHP